MYPIIIAAFAIMSLAAPIASGATGQLQGNYQGSVTTGAVTSSLELTCTSETSCTLVTKMDGMKPHTAHLDKVIPGKISHANDAFEYARRQTVNTITTAEFAAIHATLRPVFQSLAKITACWDLNYPTPNNTLACFVDQSPFSEQQIYIMFALPANCNQGFCNYVIQPLDRR